MVTLEMSLIVIRHAIHSVKMVNVLIGVYVHVMMDGLEKDALKSQREFLISYNNFNPQVSSDEITKFTSYWQALAKVACDSLDKIDTTAGLLVQIIDDSKKYCGSIPALTDKMGKLYEEIHTFQFNLITAMAAYMRSTVALDAATVLKSEFNAQKEATLTTTLALSGALGYLSYKTHVLRIAVLYCNVLEYMEGGVRPSECQGAATDISLLISSNHPVCISETYRHYYVPTSSDTDKAFVNITQLFSGSPVHFQIPSSEWLIEHGWIFERERDFALYVKKFDVYLPVKTNKQTNFYVEADPVYHNVITPENASTQYIIEPHIKLIHEYSTGPSSLVCRNPKFENPYTSCETHNINQICPFSQLTEWPLYPSIYSLWSLSVSGGEHLPVPDSATPLSAIFGMQLCKMSRNSMALIEEKIVKIQHEHHHDDCCPNGQYKPSVDSSTCEYCPHNSHSALAGYYCEND